MTTNFFGIFCFRICWYLVLCCRHSKRSEKTKSLFSASCCIFVCFLRWSFSYFQKFFFFLTISSLGIFCFRISWRLTRCCWLSDCSEVTKRLVSASGCFSCLFLRLNCSYLKKKCFFFKVFFRLIYFHLTVYLVAWNDTPSLYRK